MASSSLIERNPKATVGAIATPSSSGSSRISRQWSDLSYDLLVSILSRLSSVDLTVGVSSVCSSWRVAARNPHCWRIVDLSDWDSVTARIPVPVTFNQVLNRVLGFAHGGELIEEVYFPPIANGQDLILASDRLPNLLYFSFENPNLHGDEFCTALTKFKSLRGIAVNQVYFLFSQVLPVLSANFPNLSELKLLGGESNLYKYLVLMICKFLPKLRKLEMTEMELSSSATLMLLDSLEHLEYLDISGYDESGISKEIIEKASRLKVFIWHSSRDLGEFVECSNCGEREHQIAGPTCQCMFGERVMEWLTQT